MRIIVLFITTVLLGSYLSAQNYQNVSANSADSLIQANYLNPNFIVLDIRTIGEYNTKHIENGVELNYYQSDFNDVLDTLIKDKIYLIHCASGARSGNAFTSMQTKGFTDVYNLDGGINAWESAGLPVTTEVQPIMLTISDTLVDFIGTDIGYTDNLEVKFTNYGNDTLKILSISDLSGTDFSVNFNLNDSLTGLMDFTFNVLYSPSDLINDSVVFTVESNGQTIEYLLRGSALNTYISNIEAKDISIYPNPSNGLFTVTGEDIKNIKVININGQIVLNKDINSFNTQLDLTLFEEGIYFVKLTGNKNVILKKLIKK